MIVPINLQYDLNNLFDWCNLNGLNLNINKCKILSFNIKKSHIFILIINLVMSLLNLWIKLPTWEPIRF